jgi:hypothetical protein
VLACPVLNGMSSPPRNRGGVRALPRPVDLGFEAGSARFRGSNKTEELDRGTRTSNKRPLRAEGFCCCSFVQSRRRNKKKAAGGNPGKEPPTAEEQGSPSLTLTVYKGIAIVSR